MKIYCDTDTLLNNVERHREQNQVQRELEALKELLGRRQSCALTIYRSRVALRELERTPNQDQRARLRADCESLAQIPQDERVYGFNNEIDLHGCSSCYPLVSDVQDEAICHELQTHGISLGDAQQITQAVCNTCDVFLTRGKESIISQRPWIEERFPGLRVRLPTELLEETRSGRHLGCRPVHE
jgi:hypothetical protein